jgi:flagellar basal body-associated protein FliL
VEFSIESIIIFIVTIIILVMVAGYIMFFVKNRKRN